MFIDYFYVLLYVRYLQILLRLVVITILVILERNVLLISSIIFFQESITFEALLDHCNAI